MPPVEGHVQEDFSHLEDEPDGKPKTQVVEMVSPDDLKKENRGVWANQAEFILSCMGYAVGLGNVWRFPYLAYINGGGAFLIPFAIMLTLVGIPCFFIELTLGQYSRGGPQKAWSKVSPLFQGVGVGMLVTSFYGTIYYNMIIAWSLFYLFASFQKELPWAHCRNDFNTDFCYSKTEAEDCEESGDMFFNGTCYTTEAIANSSEVYQCLYPNSTLCEPVDATSNCSLEEFLDEVVNCTRRTGASEEYFNYGLLNISGDIEKTGDLQWELVLCLLLAWIICYLCVIKGIQSAGKVVYFTATFPYLVILILLIRGVTLDGAKKGIEFYIIPDWEELKKPKVWADAAGQVFFSLSVGLGGLMSFASYNKFHNNIYRDTLIVTIADGLTAFIAGFAIFSILGHMATVLDQDVSDVVASGSGLAFIVYPEVVTYFPVSQLWSILFFLMLLTLGLDSQFAGIENIQTAMLDLFPKLRKYKSLTAGILCAAFFLLGLPMCTQAGIYWEELMSYYASGWSLIFIALAESAVIAYCYGAGNLKRDIEVMVGFKLYIHWWICWMFITPPLLVFILVFNFYEFTPLSYGDYQLQSWAQALGWLMPVSAVICIPILAIYTIVTSWNKTEYRDISSCQRIIKLMQPASNWRVVEEMEENENDTTPPPSYTDIFHDRKTNQEDTKAGKRNIAYESYVDEDTNDETETATRESETHL